MEAPKEHTSEEGKPFHILLVDGNMDLLATYVELFWYWGYRVTSALRAQKAVELMREEDFDLVMTELWLPDLGGVKLIRALRAYNPHVPIIITTRHLKARLAEIAAGQEHPTPDTPTEPNPPIQ